MNKKALKILEFNRIKDRLVGHTSSNLGRRLAMELEPINDIKTITHKLKESEEALSLIYALGRPPIYEIQDFRLLLRHVEKGGSLDNRELLDAATLLRSVQDTKKYFNDNEENIEKFPIVGNLISLLKPYPNIERQISNAIISETEISDNASSELKRIRREIISKTDSIRVKLNQILKSQSSQKLLQDSYVTVRDGRYVIPVKSENKSSVKGIVHDQSSSGQTVFIEPIAVVEINNDIRTLQLEEADEIKKILKELSNLLLNVHEDIIHNQNNMAQLDFIFAKGSLGIDLNGIRPEVNTLGIVDMKSARHPLLDPEKVVPIDLNLGDDYNTLVITGPNTGGKTVTLKTLGLLTIMTQSGLLIPCKQDTKIAVFDEVYSDIGDEQSIEQSLSTFSSHMTNIVDILKNVKQNSLVLFDELGAGTDPTEGAALAISILSRLLKRNIRTVATTHYSQLKLFALNTPGVKNGSVEFDVKTLSPTFKLTIGIPGKSNAFEISRRLGLSESIISDAKKIIPKEEQSFEDILNQIDTDRKEIEESKQRQILLEQEVSNLKRRLDSEIEKSKNERANIIEQAQSEAYEIIRSAKEESSQLLKELKFLSNSNKDNIASQAVDIENRFNKHLDKKSENKSILKVNKKSGKEDIKLGDNVEILGMGEVGEVVTNPDRKGEVQVQVGIMKVNANIKNLKLVESEEEKKANYSIKSIIQSKSGSNVKRELDLRGKNIEESIYEIDKFLDDAYIVGIKELSIIHGKGTGVLRKGVQEYLRTHRLIKKFRDGEFNEGGLGVTVVELK
ncbi:endonuclease MutS2 [Lagierella sp.]|uniref:endonuclease MutS2 n=1 Tax=Lagierella sp. TaxID=2849657 RepID=UPI00262A8D5C|nr:endonuclease MutS2 [Lagierella sp.]